MVYSVVFCFKNKLNLKYAQRFETNICLDCSRYYENMKSHKYLGYEVDNFLKYIFQFRPFDPRAY